MIKSDSIKAGVMLAGLAVAAYAAYKVYKVGGSAVEAVGETVDRIKDGVASAAKTVKQATVDQFSGRPIGMTTQQMEALTQQQRQNIQDIADDPAYDTTGGGGMFRMSFSESTGLMSSAQVSEPVQPMEA